MPLSEEEIKQIADAMVERVHETQHSFWIEPESHYQDHLAMREIVGSWRSAKGIFTRAFLGLVIVGALAIMVAGAIAAKFGG